MQTFARWVSLPENRSAQAAVERVSQCVAGRQTRRAINPLFLHGPTGTGKTHLVSALAANVAGNAPDLTITVLPAGDVEALLRPDDNGANGEGFAAARQADLLIVEDLQHLSARAAEAFVQLIDYRKARERQMVFTASAGPAQLVHLPTRLTSRLTSGLVVGMLPLSPASRLAFLRKQAEKRQLTIDPAVLEWLSGHVAGSARQLEGALVRLETLIRLHDGPPDVSALAEHFRTEADAGRPTVERIAQRVGRYFQVEPTQLQSRRRSRNALLPRQVGMYLARQLTELSLRQIGAYFGGRDHSTVLHACRKVEQALAKDVTLSGAVRQLHADLA